MNLDELKPLWKSYQDKVEQTDHWSKTQLEQLLGEQTTASPHRNSFRVLLNVSVSLLLLGIGGC